MTTHFVYILLCGDGTLYTGYTIHLLNRFIKHCSGKGAKYTRGRLPLDMVYYEQFDTKSKALRREHQIKRLTKKQKLQLCYLQKRDTKGV